MDDKKISYGNVYVSLSMMNYEFAWVLDDKFPDVLAGSFTFFPIISDQQFNRETPILLAIRNFLYVTLRNNVRKKNENAVGQENFVEIFIGSLNRSEGKRTRNFSDWENIWNSRFRTQWNF